MTNEYQLYEKYKNMFAEYTAGDLFAGIGGITLGMINAGAKVLWANEIDKHACVTYKKNFSHHLIEGDIKNISNPKSLDYVDILCGGFPCQAFSIAGYKKGFEDDRGNVFFEIIRFVKLLEPRVIFLENVKNLQGHDNGKTFKVITDSIESLGYSIKHNVLNTCEYSVIPQNRERIYIVAFKDKDAFDSFSFPKKNSDNINPKTLLEKSVDNYYYYNESKYYSKLNEAMKNPDAIYQWRRIYVRENKSGVCPTLTANMGTGGHNVPIIRDEKGIRKLTPRECIRFQGFPDDYILPYSDLPRSSLYKQAGNSVSVPVIEAIAKKIMQALNECDQRNVYRKSA